MLKNATYQEKFQILKPWVPVLIDAVKKDLRNEHLKADVRFFKKYFQGKNAQKLTVEELTPAYIQEITVETNEELGEFVCNRWLVKHTELYDFFAHELEKINPQFDEIKEIELSKGREIIKSALNQFHAVDVYLFAVINSVVFPDQIFKELEESTKKTQTQRATAEKQQKEQASIEKMQQDHDLELSRVTNKYEKKLSGMQKKYFDDVAILKKQISSLQRKLEGQCVGAKN